jgi:hypothetical protein
MEGRIMALSYTSLSSGGAASNDFTITTGTSGYTSATLSTSFPAGSYIITSSLSDTSMDIYLIATDGTSAGYVNTTTASSSITASKAFNKVVIYGATNSDTLTFQFKYVFALDTASSSDTAAAPTITSLSTFALPDQNNSTIVTGKNFATDVTFSFMGSDSVLRTAKSVTRSSSTSATIVRPDTFPPTYAPYKVIASNPGIASPTSTNLHQTSSVITTKPDSPTNIVASKTQTAGAISVAFTAPATGGSAITGYTVTSSPGNITANGASSPITVSGLTAGTSYTFTVFATNANGNGIASSASNSLTPPQPFTQAFTSSGNWTAPSGTNVVELTAVAGGGSAGGGSYARNSGGGAGGVVYSPTQAVTAGTNYAITIGAAGTAVSTSTPNTLGNNGGATTFGNIVNAVGGGKGGATQSTQGSNGGSGGGAALGPNQSGQSNTYGSGTAGQGNRGGAGHSVGNVPGGAGGGYSNAANDSTGSNNVGSNGGNGFSIPGYNLVAGGGAGSITWWGYDNNATYYSGPGNGHQGYGGGASGTNAYGNFTTNPVAGVVFMRYNA